MEGLRICPQWLQADLLRALAALLYENVGQVVKVSDISIDICIDILSFLGCLFLTVNVLVTRHLEIAFSLSIRMLRCV